MQLGVHFLIAGKKSLPVNNGEHIKGRLSLLVRVTGFEPARLAAQDPKSCTSANSAIPAYMMQMPVLCDLICTARSLQMSDRLKYHTLMHTYYF